MRAERMIDPDSDILELYSAGRRGQALRMLIERHGQTIYRYCHKQLSDATLADDICQDVFAVAYDDLRTFKRRSALRTWLLSIARHRVLNAAKSRKRQQAREIVLAECCGEYDPWPSFVKSLDECRVRDMLVSCVGRLPVHTQAALLLKYMQGFTYEEMAQICGEKAGTLQAQVQRALGSLRELLVDYQC